MTILLIVFLACMAIGLVARYAAWERKNAPRPRRSRSDGGDGGGGFGDDGGGDGGD